VTSQGTRDWLRRLALLLVVTMVGSSANAQFNKPGKPLTSNRYHLPPSAYLQSLGPFRVDQADLNELKFFYGRAKRIVRSVAWTQTW
jgi:hypothetical protein